jgi:hypothetical protein
VASEEKKRKMVVEKGFRIKWKYGKHHDAINKFIQGVLFQISALNWDQNSGVLK